MVITAMEENNAREGGVEMEFGEVGGEYRKLCYEGDIWG